MAHECRHILSNGARCGAVALTGKPYCFFHARAHRLSSQPPPSPGEKLRLPLLEAKNDVQLAVAQVLDAVCSSRLDARRAGLCLYGIQIAARHVPPSIFPVSLDSVQDVTQSESGEDLAPEKRRCAIPKDCVTCTESETCKDYQPRKRA